jgi:membrane fusion protein, multidrug efflux system
MASTTQSATTAPEIAEHEPAIKPAKAKRLYLIGGGIIVFLVLLYGLYAFLSSGKETTDDAQVAADVVPVAARVAGQVVVVHIAENQAVHRGDLIVELDSKDAEVKVAQAQGDLATAEAQAADADARTQVMQAMARGGLEAARGALENSQDTVGTSAAQIQQATASLSRAEANAQKARLDYQRAEELGGKGDISKSQVDAARAAHEAADADVAQMRAALSAAQNAQHAAQANVASAQGRLTQSTPVGAQIDSAQAQARLAHAHVATAQAALQAAALNLSYAKVTAPSDGIASRLGVRVGSWVTAGQAIVQIVPARTYLLANFKETQLGQMRPGQRATVRVDVLGRTEFEGKVESFSGGTGATFSVLPPDNASGNFVKVVQRVPVRVSWTGPPANEVPAGSSAEVTVYTK